MFVGEVCPLSTSASSISVDGDRIADAAAKPSHVPGFNNVKGQNASHVSYEFVHITSCISPVSDLHPLKAAPLFGRNEEAIPKEPPQVTAG